MSTLRADSYAARSAGTVPEFTDGAVIAGIATITTSGVSISSGIDISGVTTASSFVGNLTGTSTGLSGTPSITVDTINSANVIVSSGNSVTATQFYGGGGNLTGVTPSPWELLSSTVFADNVSYVDYVGFNTSYLKYKIVISGVRTATGGAAGDNKMSGRFFVNGDTTTPVGTNDYYHAAQYRGYTSGTLGSDVGTDSWIKLSANENFRRMDGEINIYIPSNQGTGNNSADNKYCSYHSTTNGSWMSGSVKLGGSYDDSLTGIRIYGNTPSSAANFYDGRFDLYGFKRPT